MRSALALTLYVLRYDMSISIYGQYFLYVPCGWIMPLCYYFVHDNFESEIISVISCHIITIAATAIMPLTSIISLHVSAFMRLLACQTRFWHFDIIDLLITRN